MALTLEQLKSLVDGEGMHYFLAPDRAALLLGFRGMFGRYQVLINLELEGTFLQFRTMGYLNCPSDHPHLTAVLKVLGSINYQKRFVKLGWDPNDGEIAVYADAWLQDGTLTQSQFGRMMNNYLPVLDVSYGRLKKTMETGEDPGEDDPATTLASALGGSGASLPPELAKLVEKLQGKGKKPPEDEGKKSPGGEGPDVSEI